MKERKKERKKEIGSDCTKFNIEEERMKKMEERFI